MKQFILKLLAFILGLLTLITIFLIVLQFGSPEDFLNSKMEAKSDAFPLNLDEMNIIIAGDSRAERQIDPSIIKEKTGINAINIAVSSGDLISTSYLILKNYSNSNFLFIISASSWQINDGAIEPGYLSENCFELLTVFEKFYLYRNSMQELRNQYIKYFKRKLLSNTEVKEIHYDERIIRDLGFDGIEGVMDIEGTANGFLGTHPWYKNFSNNGARWRIFQEAVKILGRSKSKYIIYQPPVSPYWKKITENSNIEFEEGQYSKKVDDLICNYGNIEFYNFYDNDFPELVNSVYYDPQHLNKIGASLFSNEIANLILSRMK